MSPIDDSGSARIIRDEDSFFRNNRGLKEMGHLIAFIAGMVGAAFGLAAIWGFTQTFSDWPTMGQYSVALLLAGAGLEYGTTRIDNGR